MAEPLTIIGIMVDRRAEHAPEVQEVITRHGEDIVCRMGVPSPSKEKGLITVVYKGDSSGAEHFYNQLEDISGVDVRMVRFSG
jgi:putative iron-only hydrogenase system regulator